MASDQHAATLVLPNPNYPKCKEIWNVSSLEDPLVVTGLGLAAVRLSPGQTVEITRTADADGSGKFHWERGSVDTIAPDTAKKVVTEIGKI